MVMFRCCYISALDLALSEFGNVRVAVKICVIDTLGVYVAELTVLLGSESLREVSAESCTCQL